MSYLSSNSESQQIQSLPESFYRYKSVIDDAITKTLRHDNYSANQMLEYAMGWSDIHGNPESTSKGKALRPTLCLLASQATGEPIIQALPAAISLELIHNSSIIHDDIQDLDETRRHRPTLWKVWGKSKSLVVGDILKIIADITLWNLPNNTQTFVQVQHAIKLITQAYLEMVEGQFLDISFEGRLDINLEEYLRMIGKKTSALIRCSLHVGALLGTNDQKIVQSFRKYGESLGLLFQIRDDILGVSGDTKFTGKPVGADIRRKKNTLPVIFAMEQVKGKDIQTLRNIYRNPDVTENEVHTALDIIEKVGAIKYANDLAQKHEKIAITTIKELKISPEVHGELRNIANFLMTREH